MESIQTVSDSVWKSPIIGAMKLNVDATFYPTSREAGLGMVVRDHMGEVHLCAVTRVENIESPLHAELTAILFGIKEAVSIKHPYLIVESDSLMAVREIEKQRESFCEWESIILDILEISREFWSCKFSHTRRSANSFAHNMARLGTVLGDFYVWRNSWPPIFL